MSTFSIGNKVIALKNGEYQKVVKGKQYVVQDVSYCTHCGEQRINVLNEPFNGNIICSHGCGRKQPSHGFKVTSSKFFIKVEEIEDKIKEAVECEDYELAHLLSNI